jgi:DNA-binding MarR family transcriptional regulator
MPMLPYNPSRKESAGWMFKTISNWIDKELSRQLKPLGISRVHFPIMMVLLEDEGLTQAEIGNKISMPGYATSRNIDQLEYRNLVKRQVHESSRRSHRIYLTPQGKELGSELITLADSLSEKLLDPLKDDERETLKKMLKRVTWSVVLDPPEYE